MASKGLGKGLDALMAEADEEVSLDVNVKEENGVKVKTNANLPEGITADENGTLWVNPSLLKPNPFQPRAEFNEDDLLELTESVRKEGVLSPVIIEDAGDGTFYIIAGERRTRAARNAGLEKIPVQLRKYSDVRKLEVALIENIQRADLNPLEEAQAYYRLMELAKITQDEVASRLGKNRSTVANSIRLLKLPEDMRKSLVKNEITPGHARAILSLDSDTDMRILFGKILGQKLSVRQAESLAKEMKEGKPSEKENTKLAKKDERDPNYIALENKLIEVLGTKVQLKGDFDKGVISINYFSRDDLDRIYNLIIK